MRFKVTSILVLFSLFLTQTLLAVGQVVGPATQLPKTITIPAGTVIPLTLITVIKSKSTKPGDLVRAQVAFPITVGSQVAIPAGSYVEGSVEAVAAKKTKSSPGGLQIHFTRLIYANGYAVSLDALSSHAQMTSPFPGVALSEGRNVAWEVAPVAKSDQETSPSLMRVRYMGFASPMEGQAAPTPPPLPALPGPPKAFLIAVAVGGAIAIASILLVIFGHRSHNDTLLYDSGWQFSMTLSTPIAIDRVQAMPDSAQGEAKKTILQIPSAGASATRPSGKMKLAKQDVPRVEQPALGSLIYLPQNGG